MNKQVTQFRYLLSTKFPKCDFSMCLLGFRFCSVQLYNIKLVLHPTSSLNKYDIEICHNQSYFTRHQIQDGLKCDCRKPLPGILHFSPFKVTDLYDRCRPQVQFSIQLVSFEPQKYTLKAKYFLTFMF